ncbi:unnamed protein product [Linum tenue]|uniref:FAD-binding PCMH-type domain-containing protein n=1 Tax=Linum tenue TaxID=586396 RepID=A0AAV0ISD3_9ROSI|nr:unnamed protein product [Linum tenue]
MKFPTSLLSLTRFLLLLLLPFFSSAWLDVSVATNTQPQYHDLLHCLCSQEDAICNLIYTAQNSTAYASVLQFSIRNPRFSNNNASSSSSRTKPIAIVTPTTIPQVQSTVLCSRKHGLHLRVRSGGHDFEGASYASLSSPFLLLDLVNLRNVTVDVPSKSAWAQSGAVLAEVYHSIASASRTLAFPAGLCPTVGLGGHISGGGYGTTLRKFGMAADNIRDALLVDADGRVLDRAAMGEGVFWAIRGGGGNTYGIVVSWKLKLVRVPLRLSAFTVSRTASSDAEMTKLVDRYQRVTDKLPDDLMILVMIGAVDQGNSTKQVMYLGGKERLLRVMNESFPELGLKEEDCKEMSWIESVLHFANYPSNSTYDVLLKSRTDSPISFAKLKAKSDYVGTPLPESALQGIWSRVHQVEAGAALLHLIPHGGMMSRISDSSTPYPYRAGTVYKIQYYVAWSGEQKEVEERHLGWIRKLHEFLTPFVSKNPRGAYANSRDLDLGMNDPTGETSYEQARVWGEQYFKHNFERLARVKAAIDPSNFFRNEQSVPPLSM